MTMLDGFNKKYLRLYAPFLFSLQFFTTQLRAGRSEDHEYRPAGPIDDSAAGRKNKLQAVDETIVAVMRNANLLKNVRMHNQSMEPLRLWKEQGSVFP